MAAGPDDQSVYLGLGSNCRPGEHLRAGLAALREKFDTVDVSPVYRSAAVGFVGAPFLNCCTRITTALAMTELKRWLTDLEVRHGRKRDLPKFSDRNLDIDILLYGDLVGPVDGLELPRPDILKYAHVLKPLVDLAPDLVHPLTGRTVAEHWSGFTGDRRLVAVELERV